MEDLELNPNEKVLLKQNTPNEFILTDIRFIKPISLKLSSKKLRKYNFFGITDENYHFIELKYLKKIDLDANLIILHFERILLKEELEKIYKKKLHIRKSRKLIDIWISFDSRKIKNQLLVNLINMFPEILISAWCICP